MIAWTRGGLPTAETARATDSIDAVVVKAKARRNAAVVLRSKRQVIIQSRILIATLETAVAYDPVKQHNQPKPELYDELEVDKPGARDDIKELIAELKKLNDFLAAMKKPTKSDEKNIVNLRKHLNAFLATYAKMTGIGAGLLTLGLMSSLLYHIGGKEIVDLALTWKPKL